MSPTTVPYGVHKRASKPKGFSLPKFLIKGLLWAKEPRSVLPQVVSIDTSTVFHRYLFQNCLKDLWISSKVPNDATGKMVTCVIRKFCKSYLKDWKEKR